MRKQAGIDLEKKAVLAPTRLGVKAGLKKAVGEAVASLTRDSDGFWVRGSGLVYIPKNRGNEIPKVLEEHRRWQSKQSMYLTYIRRVF